jgi:SP family myo-inositol transporter-like MFS transporter 13
MLVSLFFLSLYNLSPPGTFAFYAMVALLGILFVHVFIPETKGLDLEDLAASNSSSDSFEEELIE